VRIALITAERGEQPASSLLAGLASRHELHLFVLGPQGDPAPAGARVHQVAIASGLLAGGRSWVHLARALRAAGPFDVVHAFLGGPASALALAAARALGAPLAVSFDEGQGLLGWGLGRLAARAGVPIIRSTDPVALVDEAYQAVRAGRPGVAPMPAEQAYDLWARTYDQQENNLLLHLDRELTFGDTTASHWQGKKILDFGCGTGRHWRTLQSFGPELLVGVDVSAEMLSKLKASYPDAEVYQVRDESLPMFVDGELDLVLSNLTIGYVSDLERVVREWSRVLRPGGEVMVTDMHPAAAGRGAKRTFTEGGSSLEIENHPRDPRAIEELARACGLMPVTFAERLVDETTRPFYERAQALPVYQRMKGTPLVYKLTLIKESERSP
jgi:ubiquinone/menaquinone biosynthesis C-methylase UbiE